MEEKKSGGLYKPVISIVTIASYAATIYGILSSAFGFIDLLNEQGTDAFKSLIKPAIMVVIALILSVAYFTSGDSKSNKKRKRKGESASDAEAGSAEAGNDAPGKFSAAAGRLFRTVMKTLLAILIIAIITVGGFIWLQYREYTQRPVINVTEYFDLSEAINGYDGQATYDESQVHFNLQELKYKDVFRESPRFDNKKDYDEESSLWDEYLKNLEYKVTVTGEDGTEKTSGISNNDNVNIMVKYRSTDLIAQQGKMHLRFEGIGDKGNSVKVSDLKLLPYKFESAEQAASEKADVINAAMALLEDKCVNVAGWKNYESNAVLCMSDKRPDQLVIVAKYSQDEFIDDDWYAACYIYPFDSNITTDVVKDDWDNYGDGPKCYVVHYNVDTNDLNTDLKYGHDNDFSTPYEIKELKQFHK